MAAELPPRDIAKRAAARRAVAFVEDGMRLGLGTGSTAVWMLRCLAQRMREEGLSVSGLASSARTAAMAEELGIPSIAEDEAEMLDLAIDGADEVDPARAMIKGGGGALLREKIVAAASDRMVLIADPSKEVATLGAFPLPVEVVPFAVRTTRALIGRALAGLDVAGSGIVLRESGGAPFVTDGGNRVLDLHLGRIGDAHAVSAALNQVPGVVETGLFLDLCDTVVIGREDGSVTLRDGDDRPQEVEDNVFTEIAGGAQ